MKVTLTTYGQKEMKKKMNIKSRRGRERMAALAYERGHPLLNQNKEGNERLIEYQDHLFYFDNDNVLAGIIKAPKQKFKERRVLLEQVSLLEAKTTIANL